MHDVPFFRSLLRVISTRTLLAMIIIIMLPMHLVCAE